MHGGGSSGAEPPAQRHGPTKTTASAPMPSAASNRNQQRRWVGWMGLEAGGAAAGCCSGLTSASDAMGGAASAVRGSVRPALSPHHHCCLPLAFRAHGAAAGPIQM